MGDRAKPCPTSTFILKIGDKKPFHGSLVFLSMRYSLKKLTTCVSRPTMQIICVRSQ